MSYTAAVITVSDLGSRGLRQDTSGPAVCAMLETMGFSVVHTAMVPDEAEKISAELRACADEKKIGLIVTTGGTGLSPARRDPGGDACRPRPRDPRHPRRHVGREPENHAPRHALPRRGRHARQQPDSEPPRLRKGCAGKPLCRHRRTGARHAHDRRRGSRVTAESIACGCQRIFCPNCAV